MATELGLAAVGQASKAERALAAELLDGEPEPVRRRSDDG
jgi:hypothetical protein